MSKARNLADLLSDGTVVNGVPRIIESTTLPTTGFKLGDFWYDTEDALMSVCVEVDSLLQWKEIG